MPCSPHLGSPFFYFSSDQLVAADVLPSVDRQAKTGEWAWRTIRPRFFDGFHRCAAAIADAGNDMILEHVIEFRSWYVDLVTLLRHHAGVLRRRALSKSASWSEESGFVAIEGSVRAARIWKTGYTRGAGTMSTVDTSRFSEEATRDLVVEAFRRHDPERSAFRAAWLDLQRGGACSP